MDIGHPKQIVLSALNLFQTKSRYDDLNHQLSGLDKELCDLSHYIELSNDKEVQGGYKLYKDIRNVSRRRREVKNELELIEPIISLCKELGDFNGKLRQTIESISIIEQRQCGKVYTPRVRYDLFPKAETILPPPSLDSLISKMKRDSGKRKKGRY